MMMHALMAHKAQAAKMASGRGGRKGVMRKSPLELALAAAVSGAEMLRGFAGMTLLLLQPRPVSKIR